jgi:general secretion pathway protein B
MSYILDALKKLEHEKSRKSRRDGIINISGALFENERPKPSGASGWKIVLAVMVAVLLTFAATWLFLKSGKERARTSSRPVIQVSQTSPVKVETAPVQPASPAPPVITTQQTPPAAPPAPAHVLPVRPPVNSLKSQKVAMPVATVTDEAAAELTISELRKRTKDQQGSTTPADITSAVPADIKLSGIAWQEERRARRVVVNGFLMQEGGVVSGAKITDIFQDRVRFLLSGKIFDIPLISSTVSAAGK